MTNLFLKVNKDLFKLGLNPTEILILAQVMEYNTNTGDCYISDKALSSMFGVGEKTISRELKVLEEKGYIKRTTKNTKNGRERHIAVIYDNLIPVEETNSAEIDKPTDNLTIGNESKPTDKMTVPQQSNCLFHNGQNDFIKYNSNEKDNEKDNKGEVSSPNGEETPLPEGKQLDEIPAWKLAIIDENNYTFVEEDVIKVLSSGKLFRVVGGKAVSASA